MAGQQQLIRQTVGQALADWSVAEAAGVAYSTWSAEPNLGGRIMEADNIRPGLRNLGRAPWIEYQILDADYQNNWQGGGQLIVRLELSVYYNRFTADAVASTADIIQACVNSIRTLPREPFLSVGGLRLYEPENLEGFPCLMLQRAELEIQQDYAVSEPEGEPIFIEEQE